MSRAELEIVRTDEIDTGYQERLRTEELSDDVFYTFIGRVDKLSRHVVKGLVRLQYTDTIPRSSGMRAYTRMVLVDADLQPTIHIDSRITQGYWTPQSHNELLVRRFGVNLAVNQGFFVPNEDDGIDPELLDKWVDEFSHTPVVPSDLIDA